MNNIYYILCKFPRYLKIFIIYYVSLKKRIIFDEVFKSYLLEKCI